jgi:predicted RNA binding protein YcfA (HicA-like mRNA interferase family)
MRLPRDISAQDLIKASKKLGYEVTRQTGSHIRLSTQQNGEHHITVPNHDPIKIGTLSAILSDIAIHFKLSKDEVVQRFFW